MRTLTVRRVEANLTYAPVAMIEKQTAAPAGGGPVDDTIGRPAGPSNEEPPRDAWSGLRWWEPVLVGVAALVVYALHGFHNQLFRDNSIFAYGGQQILDGTPPYVSIFNVIGPGGHLASALGAAIGRLVGIDDLMGMRILFWVVSALCVVAVFLLAQTLFRSRATALVAAATFLAFQPYLTMATAGPREKSLMLLFVVLALLCAARHSWLAAGAAASLATLTWQPSVGVAIAVMAAAALVGPPASRLRAIVSTVSGGLIPLVAVLGYFALERALGWFADGFLGIGLRASTQLDESFGDRAVRVARVVDSSFGVSGWLFWVGVVAMVGIMVWRFRVGNDWRQRGADPFLGSIVTFVLGVAWTLYDFQAAPDLFLLLPFAAVGIGGVVHGAGVLLDARVARGIAIGVAVGACVLAVVTSLSERNQLLERQRASVDALVEQLPRGARVLSVGAPQAMVIAGWTNPNPYLVMYPAPAAHLEANWPGGMDGFVAELDADPPEVILRRPHLDDDEPAVDEAGGSVLNDWIEANYVPAGGAPGWTWMVHRSIADDVERVRPSLG